MKKICYSILALILLSSNIFISGCKKSSVDGHVAQIQTGSAITSFQYDNQGRLTSFTNANGTVALTYSQSSVSVSSNGNTTVYTLNNQGYASTDGLDVFAYDNNGYLTSITNNNSGTTTNYAMSNGNLSTIISGNATQDAFTYLSNTDYRDYGLYFLGKAGSYTNLNPKSHNLVNTDIEGATTFQYTYTYDSKGRVQTQTVTGGGGSSTNVYTYTSN